MDKLPAAAVAKDAFPSSGSFVPNFTSMLDEVRL